MNATNDTIAAIATAPGESAIAIVRAAGPDALAIADKVFRCSAPRPSERDGNQFIYGHVHHPAHPEQTIDEAILLLYKAPHSYTREHAIEIQCHGGTTSARRILSALIEAGARPADPGEFTRRAFLAGRIDLTQAEAVLDLIHARTEQAASSAVEQLAGYLTTTLATTYNTLVATGALVEATLDFDEEELPADALDGAGPNLQSAITAIGGLLDTWGEGRLLREGALVAITGAPNVGKSTLLNALLGTERAIVHDRPGTTRDTIEEALVLDGLLVRLVDTAGMRDTDCAVEREGIDRAVESSEVANVRLHVVDASRPLDEHQRGLLDRADQATTLVVLNKTDLGQQVTSGDLPGFKCVSAALITGSGVPEVRSALMELLHFGPSQTPHATVSERHRSLLDTAMKDLKEAASLLATEDPANHVLVATHIRSAVESIGQITGRSYDKDLLDSVFFQFCIGK